MSYIPATLDQVKAILPTSTTLTDAQINAAIDAAKCLVDQIAVGCSSNLTDDCLTQVHIYLSAHFAANTENTLSLSSEKDGCADSSVTYGFVFKEGVLGTMFGQSANMLSGGCLHEMDKQPVNLFSIGDH